jgi:hypothetical protein
MVIVTVGGNTQKSDDLRIPSSPPPSSETPERFTGREQAGSSKQGSMERIDRCGI